LPEEINAIDCELSCHHQPRPGDHVGHRAVVRRRSRRQFRRRCRHGLPDGASVTRVIALDLPSATPRWWPKIFRLTLDPSSLRVEGEGGARITIGAIDARPPRPVPPVNLSEIDKRIEALKDESSDLQGAIASAEARRKFAERFAETSRGLGEKGERARSPNGARPSRRSPRKVATADTAIASERKQRDIDREIRGFNPIATPSRPPSSRCGSISPVLPPPRRR